jgi:hypothetical protein
LADIPGSERSSSIDSECGGGLSGISGRHPVEARHRYLLPHINPVSEAAAWLVIGPELDQRSRPRRVLGRQRQADALALRRAFDDGERVARTAMCHYGDRMETRPDTTKRDNFFYLLMSIERAVGAGGITWSKADIELATKRLRNLILQIDKVAGPPQGTT